MLADNLADLGFRIWEWKDATAFRSADDIPRVAHEPGWTPRFDSASIVQRMSTLLDFRHELADLDVSGAPVSLQVDQYLLCSTLSRTRWDIEVVRSWERDANFLVSQIIGPYFDLLLPAAPFSPERQAGLVTTLAAVPAQVAVAQTNLTGHGVADLAAVALDFLDGIGDRLLASVDALAGSLDPVVATGLYPVAQAAAQALEEFGTWLGEALPGFGPSLPVGRERFIWYLRHVALIGDEPEELVRAAEQEYRRAVVGEALSRNAHPEKPTIFATIDEQVAQQRVDEARIRDFYEQNNLLSQSGFGHYLVHPVPAYVTPLGSLAVNDDLTDVRRPDTDGLAYAPDPGPGLPYFYAANASDPRLGIIHEGTHYQQLVRAFAHEDPLRRHYYDSVANEGIAFYNEEAMLVSGLFDDSSASRTVVQNFMRLRSLRVVVDVNLATGAFTLADGVETFVTRVPMDRETAEEETAMYVSAPGLAMSYLVGKLQLQAMLTTAIESSAAPFDFRSFHDWVWKNGNLPFSLQRWELLGDRSAIDKVEAGRPAW